MRVPSRVTPLVFAKGMAGLGDRWKHLEPDEIMSVALLIQDQSSDRYIGKKEFTRVFWIFREDITYTGIQEQPAYSIEQLYLELVRKRRDIALSRFYAEWQGASKDFIPAHQFHHHLYNQCEDMQNGTISVRGACGSRYGRWMATRSFNWSICVTRQKVDNQMLGVVAYMQTSHCVPGKPWGSHGFLNGRLGRVSTLSADQSRLLHHSRSLVILCEVLYQI